MARPDFPLSIDRRRLLTSAAAAATATVILPGLKRADAAAAPDFFRSSATDAPSRIFEFFRRDGSASRRNRTSK